MIEKFHVLKTLCKNIECFLSNTNSIICFWKWNVYHCDILKERIPAEKYNQTKVLHELRKVKKKKIERLRKDSLKVSCSEVFIAKILFVYISNLS